MSVTIISKFFFDKRLKASKPDKTPETEYPSRVSIFTNPSSAFLSSSTSNNFGFAIEVVLESQSQIYYLYGFALTLLRLRAPVQYFEQKKALSPYPHPLWCKTNRIFYL